MLLILDIVGTDYHYSIYYDKSSSKPRLYIAHQNFQSLLKLCRCRVTISEIKSAESSSKLTGRIYKTSSISSGDSLQIIS